MKPATTDFLRALGLFPIETGGLWTSHELQHPPPATPKERARERTALIERVPRVAGLYAYVDADGIVLYVGQTDGLRSRLRHHYDETCEPKSATGSAAYHEFFKAKPGPLQVYWTPMEDHAARRVIEVALQYVTDEAWNLTRKRKFA
jgi:hypothetical protein